MKTIHLIIELGLKTYKGYASGGFRYLPFLINKHYKGDDVVGIYNVNTYLKFVEQLEALK